MKEYSDNPRVSIIVPIYNVKRYVRKCITSIQNQSYENLEIILVDDGSSDGSSAICDEFQKIDGRVLVIHKENGGASSARKSGLELASGEYIMFVDGDDWIDDKTVQSCVESVKENQSDCILFSYVKEYGNRSIPNNVFKNDFHYKSTLIKNKIHRRLIGPLKEELKHPERIDNLSSVCMKLYKNNIARKGMIVDEKIVGTSEDTIFNIYALSECKDITYINQCFYHYRKTNEESITSQYKEKLPEKWNVLYKMIKEYIIENDNNSEYKKAFYNRIACGMIGLGLNEINSNNSIVKKVINIRIIIKQSLYQKAFKQLDVSYCPFHWKIFFLFCKWKAAFCVTLLLQLMNTLRSKLPNK